MKRSTLFAALLLLVTAIARGEVIRFDPPNPTAHHSVDAIVTGIWHDSWLPSVKSVALNGSTITLHLNADLPPDAACTQSLRQYSRTFHLDVLPAGHYTVIAVADQNGSVTELSRTTLIVRDAETLTIKPFAVPASGGEIVIDNPIFVAGATITIGGVTVPASSDVDGILVAQAPPHAP